MWCLATSQATQNNDAPMCVRAGTRSMNRIVKGVRACRANSRYRLTGAWAASQG